MNSETIKLGFDIRVKQGDLLRALRVRGWSQAQGAEFLGITQGEFGLMINMRRIRRNWPDKLASKLLELTGKLPEELFPEFVRSDEFQDAPRRLDIYRDITPAMLESFGGHLALPSPEDEYLEKEARQRLMELMQNTLGPRAEAVMRMRAEGMTFAAIGREIGVTVERARQICVVSMRKLKEAAEDAARPKPNPRDPLVYPLVTMKGDDDVYDIAEKEPWEPVARRLWEREGWLK